ncbi:HK97 family phage prohead protease [Paenibacillus oleatilyticus]|uniref:HK97 family phage prohead protease n=1 Tax=Paenibacillus oleatilyticus TaxID=2594886 RepID=UPI001C1F4DA7|nr:HK97 family phage prohead protease [Paenibacillus oleatilyticus]MBU7320283.1 HK97 family phage prohead protease [Paenibacillus oleatilyticus]
MPNRPEKAEGSVYPIARSFEMPDIRADADEKTIEGHAAVFDQKTNIGGWFFEVIERGAFDGCNFDDVLFSINHDLKKIPLARSRRNNANSTLQLSVDTKGLFIKAKLDTENNTESRALHSAVGRGDIQGMSFIFYIQEEKWENLDSDMPTRRIQKIKRVIETSAVTFPAYTGTDIQARDKTALDNARLALDNARSKGLDNSNNEQRELEILKFKAQILAKG